MAEVSSKVEVQLDADILGFLAKMKKSERALKSFKKEARGLSSGGAIAGFDKLEKKVMSTKRTFDSFDKGVKTMGSVLSKFLGLAIKGTIIQLAAMGAAMLAIHASFAIGGGLAKVYAGAMKILSGGAAGLVVALSTVAAAMREQQAAMFAFSGGGAEQFGAGINQARVAMRGLATDADLAVLGAANINKAYGAMAKTMTSTQILGSKNMMKALFDFGAAGQDPAQAAEKIGVVIEALNNSKKSFTDVQTAAKALGPQMEKAMKNLGVTSKKKFQEALLSGDLAKEGGVFGQFATVNSTLMSRIKAFFNIVKEDFADFGQKFLEPAKVAMDRIMKIIRRDLMRVGGELSAFGTGSFFDGLVTTIDKISSFFVKLIREYLPGAKGMFGNIGDTFSRLARGWDYMVEKLRPFIEGAKVVESIFSPLWRTIKEEGTKSFNSFNSQLIENASSVEEFGEKLAGLLKSAFEMARVFREMWIESLPFINDVLSGITQIFDMLRGIVSGMTGTFGATGGLMAFAIAAKQMKSTKGGLLSSVTKTMTLNPQTVIVNSPGAAPLTMNKGGTPNLYGGAGRAPSGTGVLPPGTPVSLRGVSSGGQQQIAVGPNGQQTVIPKGQKPQVISSKTRGFYTGRELYQAPTGGVPVSGITGRPIREGALAPGARLREMRGTRGGVALLGDGKNVTGAANSMGARMGVGMGLAMGSQYVPQEMQGAMALGGAVGMMSPLAGLAIAGLGGAVSARSAGAGALAGAAGGAAAGAQVGGPVGAAVGAALGALGGALMGSANKFKLEAKEAQQAISGSIDRISLQTLRGVGDKLYANIQAVEEGRSTIGSGSSINELSSFKRSTGKVYREATSIRDRNRAFTDEEIIKGTGAGSASDARSQLKLADNPALLASFMKRTGLSKETIGGASIGEAERRAGINAGQEYKKLFTSIQSGSASQYGGFKLSESEMGKVGKNASAAGEELIKRVQTENNANILVSNQSNQRMYHLRKMTGKTNAELEAMAYTLGKDLYDPTIKFTDLVSELGLTMVKTAAQMRQANTDIYVSAGNAFHSLIKQAKATEVVDEQAEAMRVAFASGNVKPNEIIEFMGNIQGSLLDKNMGDPLAAFGEFTSQIGTITKPGKAFGPGGVFEKIKPEDFFKEEVQGAVGGYSNTALTGFRGTAVTQIQSLLTSEGATVDANRLNEALQGKTPAEQMKIYEALQNTSKVTGEATGRKFDFGGFGGFAAGANVEKFNVGQEILNVLGIDLKTGSVTGSEEQAKKLDNVVDNMSSYTTGLQNNILALQAKTSELFAGVNARPDWMAPDALKKVFIEAGIIKGDTSSPRGGGVGDTTSSRLSQTMARHSSIDGMLTGTRSITSSYRTYGLGSPSSDHVTGRAIDLVGANLGQYKQLAENAGGFAEFHGRGGSRHLHVVPGPGAIGDTMVPASMKSPSMMAQPSGGGSSNNSYTININGSNASPEEIANRVMAKINDQKRAERER